MTSFRSFYVCCTLRELLLDGNDLGCEGFVALIEPMAEQAENDAISRRAEKEKKMAEEAAEQEAKAKEEGMNDVIILISNFLTVHKVTLKFTMPIAIWVE